MPRHIVPSVETFGWKIDVLKKTSGGSCGYFSLKKSFSSKIPLYHGVFSGPSITASHTNKLSSSGEALIPSCFSVCIFYSYFTNLAPASIIFLSQSLSNM